MVPRRRRTRLMLAAAAVAVLAVVLWVVERPGPWRPPSGLAFAHCRTSDGLSERCATIDGLHVAVLPATRRPAVGALFYLEGGPGGSPNVSQVLGELARVGRDRDIIVVEQRGSGLSEPIECPKARVPARDPDAVAAYVKRCFAHVRARYSTRAAAEDLERVRRTLGYGQVDLYGGSYGATLAQAYLQLHPKSVRSVTLDGASLPGVSVYERAAANAQHALGEQIARCARQPSCRAAYPDIAGDLRKALASPPRRVRIETGIFTIGPAETAWTIATLSEDPDGYVGIPSIVHAAAHGDFVPVAHSYFAHVGSDLDPRVRLAMVWELLCSEPWAGFDPGATSRRGYLGPAAVDRARLFTRACRAVPRVDARVPTRTVDVPVLLLAGSADPLDPPANVRGWRRLYPNGRLVVVPDAAHGVIQYTCVQKIVARFVAAGSARGLDTRCARSVPLPPFETF